MLRGIAAYARPARPWVFSWDNPSAEGILRLLELEPDGLLVKHVDERGFELIERAGVPTVNLGFPVANSKMRHVGHDESAIGELGAAYFVSRGYRNFGYYPNTGNPRDLRAHSFRAYLKRYGHTCHVGDAQPAHPAWPRAQASLKRDNEAICRWLTGLPKPVAVLCAADNFALTVAECCSQLELRVPDEVAILGVDNDVPVCLLSAPPLSSIQIAGERVGYAAAELLDNLMTPDGREAPKLVAVPPIRVVSRRSTDAVVASDPLVARALAYLREHATAPDCLNEFLATIRCSRRTLERKFRESIGQAPAQAWLRFRLEEATRLLADTDLSVEHVADQSGFGEIRQLQVAFRKFLHQTPTEFRRHAVPSLRQARAG